MIKTIITIITTIISFLAGFLLKKKSQENQDLKSKVNNYEKKQELQQKIIDRNVANDTITDAKLQFKKNRANYKSKSSQ